MTYIGETNLYELHSTEEKFSLNSSMINKDVLLRVFSHIFHIIFLAYTYDWDLMVYLFFTCVCIWRDFLAIYLYVYHFYEGNFFCILEVLISWLCTHVILDSNNECITRGVKWPFKTSFYRSHVFSSSKVALYIRKLELLCNYFYRVNGHESHRELGDITI